MKIGAIYPLSGNLARLGEESYRGRACQIERNAQGGVWENRSSTVADAPDTNAARSRQSG